MRKNFQRRNPSTKVLSFYLIFLFSLLIFSSTLYSTYDTYKTEEAEFNQGADLRIHTFRTYNNYSDELSSVNGIKQVTPLMKSPGYIATTEYTVYAVDPMSYLEVGYWEFANGTDTPEKPDESARAETRFNFNFKVSCK